MWIWYYQCEYEWCHACLKLSILLAACSMMSSQRPELFLLLITKISRTSCTALRSIKGNLHPLKYSFPATFYPLNLKVYNLNVYQSNCANGLYILYALYAHVKLYKCLLFSDIREIISLQSKILCYNVYV